jgi:hypothetical protein
MGRTIHYWIEKDGQNAMTDEEWQKIEELQDDYNRNHVWTCENLSFERFSIFPNWKEWDKAETNVQDVWLEISSAMDMPGGLEELQRQNLVVIKYGGYMGEKYLASGFTKVGENEKNAALVVKFLIECSILAPRIKIKVSDEGDYLAGPVLIQNGRMRPDEAGIRLTIEYWNKRAAEDEADRLEFWIGLIARYKQYLGLDDRQLDNSIFMAQQIHCQ